MVTLSKAPDLRETTLIFSVQYIHHCLFCTSEALAASGGWDNTQYTKYVHSPIGWALKSDSPDVLQGYVHIFYSLV